MSLDNDMVDIYDSVLNEAYKRGYERGYKDAQKECVRQNIKLMETNQENQP